VLRPPRSSRPSTGTSALRFTTRSLLELRKENLEIAKDSPSAGKRVSRLKLPAGSRLISVMRDGQHEIPDPETELQAGDQVLAILETGKEDELRRILLKT
jgi:Trk K+ transport system NAD-binding subunit